MGGVALGAALFKASTLGRINLGANDLGHTAIHAIADSLRSGAHGVAPNPIWFADQVMPRAYRLSWQLRRAGL